MSKPDGPQLGDAVVDDLLACLEARVQPAPTRELVRSLTDDQLLDALHFFLDRESVSSVADRPRWQRAVKEELRRRVLAKQAAESTDEDSSAR
jgi:hypothetical protein